MSVHEDEDTLLFELSENQRLFEIVFTATIRRVVDLEYRLGNL